MTIRKQYGYARFSILKDSDSMLDIFPRDQYEFGLLVFEFRRYAATARWDQYEMHAYIRNYLPKEDYEICNIEVDCSFRHCKNLWGVRYPKQMTKNVIWVEWDDLDELVPSEHSYWNELREMKVKRGRTCKKKILQRA